MVRPVLCWCGARTCTHAQVFRSEMTKSEWEKLHKAFDKGLMEYGMMTAGKKAASAPAAA